MYEILIDDNGHETYNKKNYVSDLVLKTFLRMKNNENLCFGNIQCCLTRSINDLRCVNVNGKPKQKSITEQ